MRSKFVIFLSTFLTDLFGHQYIEHGLNNQGHKKVWGIITEGSKGSLSTHDPWKVGRNSYKKVQLLPAPQVSFRNEFMSIREQIGSKGFDLWRNNPGRSHRRSSSVKKKPRGHGAVLDSFDSWEPKTMKGAWHTISAQTKDIVSCALRNVHLALVCKVFC